MTTGPISSEAFEILKLRNELRQAYDFCAEYMRLHALEKVSKRKHRHQAEVLREELQLALSKHESEKEEWVMHRDALLNERDAHVKAGADFSAAAAERAFRQLQAFRDMEAELDRVKESRGILLASVESYRADNEALKSSEAAGEAALRDQDEVIKALRAENESLKAKVAEFSAQLVVNKPATTPPGWPSVFNAKDRVGHWVRVRCEGHPADGGEYRIEAVETGSCRDGEHYFLAGAPRVSGSEAFWCGMTYLEPTATPVSPPTAQQASAGPA